MQVFISWSGIRSKKTAFALRECISAVFGNRIYPWLSSEDICAGRDWTREIELQLARSAAGILCVTPENLASPWVLFEAGALARTAFLCPYLDGVNPSQLPAPVRQFQAKGTDKTGTRDLLQALNDLLGAKDNLLAEELQSAFTSAWREFEHTISTIPKNDIDQPIIVHWPAGDVPDSHDLVTNAEESLLLLGISSYRIICGRELYPFVEWLTMDPKRQLALLFLNPSSPHALGRERLDVWQASPARTREALEQLQDRLRSEPASVRDRFIVGIREGPHRYSARAVDIWTDRPHAGIEVFVSTGQRGQAQGLRIPIARQEQPGCFRYYENELLREFRGALTNLPGHGISLVARWEDPPHGLQSLVADTLQPHCPLCGCDFYGTAQWHATITSLCRTQTCAWSEPLSLESDASDRHLPEHFPHFVHDAVAAVQARCKDVTLRFHEAFLDSDGYVGVHGTMNQPSLDALLADITQLVSHYADRYPHECWRALIRPGEPRFGPKYPTFVPHVTVGRVYDEHGSIPRPLSSSAVRVRLPEPVTLGIRQVHVVHYAYRSLLRCVGELCIPLGEQVPSDPAAIAYHLRVSQTAGSR